MLYMMDNN